MPVLPITNPAETLVAEREDLAGYCNEIFEATRRFVTCAERLCGISRLKPSHSSPPDENFHERYIPADETLSIIKFNLK